MQFYVTINTPDKHLLQQVENVIRQPGANIDELKQQVATLAKAILEVEKHCASIEVAFTTLAQKVKFTPQ